MLPLLILAACGSRAPAPKPPTPVSAGMTVSEALARCKTPYSEVTLIDEPPGKLRGLWLACHGGAPRQLELHIEYTTELFSVDRNWPEALVGPLRVTAAHWRQ